MSQRKSIRRRSAIWCGNRSRDWPAVVVVVVLVLVEAANRGVNRRRRRTRYFNARFPMDAILQTNQDDAIRVCVCVCVRVNHFE